MSSFVNAALCSDSDSDDQDYDPTVDKTAEVVSEEEDSGDDESGKKSKKKGKGKKNKETEKLGKRSGGLLMLEDEEERKREEERKKEFETEKDELKKEEEKKKVDDLWASFKQDVGPSKTSSSSSRPKPIGSGLGSWSMASSKAKVVKKVAPVKRPPPADLFSSIFDSKEEKKTSEEKSEQIPKSIFASIFEKKELAVDVTNTDDVTKPDDVTQSDDTESDKVTITKVFDFAGEAIEVTKQVSKDSKEGQKFLKASTQQPEASTSQKRPAGLNSIMGEITGKKPKLGTLEKSKMDWKTFVEQEGIKEDLQTFNKGKDGFVEKQMFLERTDLRRFEIEKAAREKSRKNI